MTRSAPMLLALLALLAGGLLLAAAPARADEEPAEEAAEPSALERLTEAERRYLEQSPGWEGLSLEQRIRIARNLIRLRNLTPEQRRQFKERLAELRRREVDDPERAPRADFLESLREREARRRLWLPRLVGAGVLEDLDPAARARLLAAAGASGRPLVGMAFWRRMMEHAAREIASEDLASLALPDDVPPPLAERLGRLLEEARAGDAQARRRLAEHLVRVRQHRLARRLGAVEARDEATRRRLTEAVKEAWGPAYRATLAELREALGGDPAALRAYLARGLGPAREAPSDADRGRARRLLQALEEVGPFEDPRLRRAFERLREGLERVAEGEPFLDAPPRGPGAGGHGRRPGGPRRGGPGRPGGPRDEGPVPGED